MTKLVLKCDQSRVIYDNDSFNHRKFSEDCPGARSFQFYKIAARRASGHSFHLYYLS